MARSCRLKRSIDYANLDNFNESDEDFKPEENIKKVKRTKSSTQKLDRNKAKDGSKKRTSSKLGSVCSVKDCISVDNNHCVEKRSKQESLNASNDVSLQTNEDCLPKINATDDISKSATTAKTQLKPKLKATSRNKRQLSTPEKVSQPEMSEDIEAPGTTKLQTVASIENIAVKRVLTASQSSNIVSERARFKQRNWNPPGVAGSQPATNPPISSPSTLRIGLSRNVRLKPLHCLKRT